MPSNAYQSAIALVEDKFAQSQTDYDVAKSDLAALIALLQSYAAELQPIDTDISPPDLTLDVNVEDFVSEKPERPDTTANFPVNTVEAPPYSDINFDDITEPEVGALTLPAVSILPGENEYTSSLLQALQRKLRQTVEEGGVALPQDAEDQWFNRESERSQQLLLDAIDMASAEWSKRSLPMPDGFLAHQITSVIVDHKNKREDISREIALKQYELADQNTRFAIERGIQLESALMTVFTQIQDRLITAARVQIEAEIAVYNAQLQKYQVEAQVYRAIVDGRIAKAKGIVDIYITRINAYRTEVEAESARLDTIIKAYLGEMEGYKVEANVFTTVSSLQVQIFDAQVRHMMASLEVLIKNAEIELKNYEVMSGIKMEGLRAVAAVLAQQIAGCWSAVQAGASISASGSTQTQTNYNYNYEE